MTAEVATWTAHTGKRRPATGDKQILVRLRCQTREQAEEHPPRLASWWPRWSHDGSSGDIIEWRHA